MPGGLCHEWDQQGERGEQGCGGSGARAHPPKAVRLLPGPQSLICETAGPAWRWACSGHLAQSTGRSAALPALSFRDGRGGTVEAVAASRTSEEGGSGVGRHRGPPGPGQKVASAIWDREGGDRRAPGPGGSVRAPRSPGAAEQGGVTPKVIRETVQGFKPSPCSVNCELVRNQKEQGLHFGRKRFTALVMRGSQGKCRRICRNTEPGGRLQCLGRGQAGPGRIPAWRGLRRWHQGQRH